MSQTTHQGSTQTENTVIRVMRIGASEVYEDALRRVEGQFPGIVQPAFDKQTGNLAAVYDTAAAFGATTLPVYANDAHHPKAEVLNV